MAIINRVAAIPVLSFNTAGLNPAAFIAVGTLPHPCFMLHIANDSNTTVTISLDGINAADVIIDDHDILLPFQTNASLPGQVNNLAKGTIIYVRGTAGAGNIYIAGYYQNTA